MDKKFIKVLIEEGTPIVDLPETDALAKLNNDIMTVYVMNGLHRGMSSDAFKEEVRACTAAMYNEFKNDKAYRSIRDREVSYIFSNGMKGRLNADKDIGLSFKNMIRWVEGYVKHQERRDAMNAYCEEHKAKMNALPMHEHTDEDSKRMVKAAWKEYKEWVEEKQFYSTKFSGAKTIEETMGFLPLSCQDYGKIRIEYLRRIGRAGKDENLVSVFERAYREGRTFDDI